MSEFDTKEARDTADQDDEDNATAIWSTGMLRQACDEIDSLRARLAEAEALHAKDAATDALIIYQAEKRAEAGDAKLAEVEKERDEAHGDAEREYGMRCLAESRLDKMAADWKVNHDMWRDRAHRYRAALEWYGMEYLYDLTSYTSASPVFDVNNPTNVYVAGNPVINDRGGKARIALAGDKEGE